MAVLVTYGDRLLTRTGRPSWLKRPSVPLLSYGRDSLPLTVDGRVMSYLGLYERQPWVAAAVNKLNRSIADVPIRLYRQKTADEVEVIYDHPVMDLILKPWELGSAFALKQKITFPALVQGNSVLGKVRATPNGPPVGFVPLDWRFLMPHVLEDGEVYFWESSQPNRQQWWPVEDVLHFRFEAGDGDIGVSPLKQLGVTMTMEEAAQTHQSSSFQNGVRPAGALMTDEDLSREQRAELRSEINAQPPGSFFLLTNGMDWKAFSHNAVEAELIDQRKLNREEAAAVYDIDPPLIGILDHATYSNISEMYDRLYQATCGPWFTMETDTLNAQLIEQEPAWADQGLFLAYDLSDKLRSDTPEEIGAVVTAIAGGVTTPNEGRSRLRWGRSTQKGADKLYLPVNNLKPMGEESEPPMPPQPDGDLPPTNGDNPIKQNILRAMERAAKKLSAGQEPWDRERFERELYQDAPQAPVEPLADLVEGLIQRAEGDPAAVRRFAASRFH